MCKTKPSITLPNLFLLKSVQSQSKGHNHSPAWLKEKKSVIPGTERDISLATETREMNEALTDSIGLSSTDKQAYKDFKVTFWVASMSTSGRQSLPPVPWQLWRGKPFFPRVMETWSVGSPQEMGNVGQSPSGLAVGCKPKVTSCFGWCLGVPQ